MKYVIFIKCGHYAPVLLPEQTMMHSDVRRTTDDGGPAPRVFSAGFCRVSGAGDVSVWGRSESLDVGPGPEDGPILSAFLRDEPPVVARVAASAAMA